MKKIKWSMGEIFTPKVDFTIAVVLVALSTMWYASQGDWTTLGFFACTLIFTLFVIKHRPFALIIAIAVSFLFKQINNVQEGLENKKGAPPVAAAASKKKISSTTTTTKDKPKEEETEEPAKKPEPKSKQDDTFTDMFSAANENNLEKLMQRQTVLMSQLKNMAPLMQSAKEAIKQLPAGYLEKALKTLKTNLKKQPLPA